MCTRMLRISKGKKQSFSMWFLENWISTHKRMELVSCLLPYTKIYSKWIKELSIRAKTIKLENKTEDRLHNVGPGNVTPKTQATKEK